MEKLIEYPKKHSESEIQALLWYFLRKKKIDARLQVVSKDNCTGRKWCKLDLVIFVNREAKCIVECKSWSSGYSRTAIYRTNNTKQIRRYKEIYGLPVLVCARMEYVTKVIPLIESVISK